jgi:hypothetical protein
MKLLKVPFFYQMDKHSSVDEISILLDDATNREVIALMPWPKFNYKPKVSFAVGYSSDYLLVKFYVAEQYLQAVYNNINDPVHKDSCVEIFIAFDNDESYYNLEFNSVGTCFAGYGRNRDDRKNLPINIIQQIKHQTLVKNRDFNEGICWELTLMIPNEVFCYHKIISLKERTCRVNLYKCGDDLPEPHFLTWNEVYSDEPDFHLPQFFGNMQFI